MSRLRVPFRPNRRPFALRRHDAGPVPRRHDEGLVLRRDDEGFSLPELMVVLSIIMLLTVLSIPRLRGAKEAAENAAAAQSMHAIQTSQEAYRITHGSYASNFRDLTNTRGGPLLEGKVQGGEDTLVYKGYIFRLRRTASDEYTVTAEPILNRDYRPWFELSPLRFLRIIQGVAVEEDVGVPGGQ